MMRVAGRRFFQIAVTEFHESNVEEDSHRKSRNHAYGWSSPSDSPLFPISHASCLFFSFLLNLHRALPPPHPIQEKSYLELHTNVVRALLGDTTPNREDNRCPS